MKSFIDIIDGFFLKNRGVLNRHKAYILGDFNTNLHDSNTTQLQLLNSFACNGFIQVVNEATRVTKTSSSLIDLIFTNTSSDCFESGVIEENLSDHYVTFIFIRLKSGTKPTRIIKSRATDNINTQVFQDKLQAELSNSTVLNFDAFHKMFQTVLDKMCPLTVKTSHKPFAPWIKNTEVQNSINSCNRLKVKSKQNPSDTQLKFNYRNAQRTVKKTINSHQLGYLYNVSQQKDSKKLWSTIKNLLHKQTPRVLVNSDAFNKYYSENAFLLTNRQPASTNQIKSDINVFSDNMATFSFKTVSPLVVEHLIMKLKNNKTDSIGISTTLIKQLHYILSPLLSHFINLTIENSYYPASLKISQLIPVPKTNTQSACPNDYRPIAIQPTFSKLFEKVLLEQMNNYIENNGIISKQQFGFRKNCSVEGLLHSLYNKLCLNLHKGCLSVIVSLDLSKAFDTLDHFILIKKLQDIGFDRNAQRLILSYLRERSVYTSANNSSSSLASISAGVPQGSILGPTLFNIYINDLSQQFSHAEIFQYADDCQILLTFTKEDTFGTITSIIQSTIVKAVTWCNNNSLRLNQNKTQIMPIFHRNSVYSSMPFYTSLTSSLPSPLSSPLRHTSSVINFIPSIKILGVYFNSKLSWNDHFYSLNKQIQKVFYSFKILFNRYTRKNDTKIRQIIISTAVIPKLTYSISLFHNYNKTCIQVWTMWNKRLLSLILRKYCHSSDVSNSSLLSLQDWVAYKLIGFVHTFFRNGKNGLFLDLNIRKTNYLSRHPLNLSIKSVPKSTEEQCALTWNKLSPSAQIEILERKLFTLKNYRAHS